MRLMLAADMPALEGDWKGLWAVASGAAGIRIGAPPENAGGAVFLSVDRVKLSSETRVLDPQKGAHVRAACAVGGENIGQGRHDMGPVLQ